MKEVIIIGWINKGKPANCGETMKNQLMINRLKELNIKCHQIDFKNWRKHPWVFIQLLWCFFIHNKATLILSSSAKNIYPMIKVLKFLKIKRNIVHWVIGGNLYERILEGAYSCEILNYASFTLVETSKMVQDLNKVGIKNVIFVPNFKQISYYPSISQKNTVSPTKFVFLSRITPEKGVNYIIESVKALNKMGMKDKFSIDFYGKCDENYRNIFLKEISNIENIKYKGLLNLQIKEAYDKLASYHTMLLPTYWVGEGFAGVFIDAFIAGLPIVLTDWAHNKAICDDCAFYIPVHNANALTKIMIEIINKSFDLDNISLLCRNKAYLYETSNVITNELLKQLNII